MISVFDIYKGIPIGTIIKRDLKKRGISQIALSRSIGISYKTLNRIINNHRTIENTYAIKIEKILNYEPSFLINLQNYIIQRDKNQKSIFLYGTTPIIRKCVFWDIGMNKLDWRKNKNFIINRVSQYGNTSEKSAINEFYGL